MKDSSSAKPQPDIALACQELIRCGIKQRERRAFIEYQNQFVVQSVYTATELDLEIEVPRAKTAEA